MSEYKEFYKDKDFIEVEYIEEERNEYGEVEKGDIIDLFKKLDPEKPVIIIGSANDFDFLEFSFKFALTKELEPCLPDSPDTVTAGFVLSELKKMKESGNKVEIEINLAECEDEDGYFAPLVIDEYTQIYDKKNNTILACDLRNI